MREPTLEQLARLRAEAVDEARRALAEAEQARDARAALCAQARERCAQRARALADARAEFVDARTVAGLRWSSGRTERAQQLRAMARAALLSAEQGLAAAEREVASRRDDVRARELGRRAIARTLERRTQEVTLRTERRHEDDLDDAFRTRSYRG